MGAGEGDDIRNIFEFTVQHPEILFPVNFGTFLGKQLLNGGKAGASVSEGHHVIRIHVVPRGPASPHARHSGSGIHKDSIHINQQTTARKVGHGRKIVA
jgi:hypothetical protein